MFCWRHSERSPILPSFASFDKTLCILHDEELINKLFPVPENGWRSVHRSSRRSGCRRAVVARRRARAKKVGRRTARAPHRTCAGRSRFRQMCSQGPGVGPRRLVCRPSRARRGPLRRRNRNDRITPIRPTLRTTNPQSKRLLRLEGGFSGLAIPRCGRFRPCPRVIDYARSRFKSPRMDVFPVCYQPLRHWNDVGPDDRGTGVRDAIVGRQRNLE